MEVSFYEVKKIADTLPIGLYAKRRIPITLGEEEQQSYYNPITDEIVISFIMIANGLSLVNDDEYKETAIRSMVYHEVSHAILTPKLTMYNWMNIFEDERIETLLANYYLDVDFKKQVLTINGYSSIKEIPKPTDPLQDFYRTVRFRLGKTEYLNEVNRIIKAYSHMNASTDSYVASSYFWEVRALFEKFCKDYGKEVGDYSEMDKNGTPVVSIDGELNASENANNDDDSIEGETAILADETINDHGSPLSDKEITALISNSVGVNNTYVDTALTQRMEMIINNFSKKNNSGSAMNAYSGVFNPRSVGIREDFKFWEKPALINGANKFGSLHLNLFIDKSGSFQWSEIPMNKLLRSLTEIESKNQNFTFDVVFCGMGEKIVQSKKDRVFKASGGNYLDKHIYDIYRKLQKPNTFNYNIACFDGDACSDGGRTEHGFGAFDHNNCVIISDNDNRRYISKDVKSAKVVYTQDYANELIDNVVDALSKAFR